LLAREHLGENCGHLVSLVLSKGSASMRELHQTSSTTAGEQISTMMLRQAARTLFQHHILIPVDQQTSVAHPQYRIDPCACGGLTRISHYVQCLEESLLISNASQMIEQLRGVVMALASVGTASEQVLIDFVMSQTSEMQVDSSNQEDQTAQVKKVIGIMKSLGFLSLVDFNVSEVYSLVHGKKDSADTVYFKLNHSRFVSEWKMQYFYKYVCSRYDGRQRNLVELFLKNPHSASGLTSNSDSCFFLNS